MKSTFRGFAAGTLALIVFYVVVQEGASRKATSATNVLVQGLRRFLSPQVAGIGDHTKTDATGGNRQGGRVAAPTADADDAQGNLFTT